MNIAATNTALTTTFWLAVLFQLRGRAGRGNFTNL
jgi:transcription-repair coupling factor (superfamily II helicase)